MNAASLGAMHTAGEGCSKTCRWCHQLRLSARMAMSVVAQQTESLFSGI